MAVMKFDEEMIKQALAYFADRQGSAIYNKENVIVSIVSGGPGQQIDWQRVEAIAISE